MAIFDTVAAVIRKLVTGATAGLLPVLALAADAPEPPAWAYPVIERVDRATDRANPNPKAAETVRGATGNAVQSIGGARDANASAGASARASVAASADLTVGETIYNTSGETIGTIDKVITARDGTVQRVFIRTRNANRNGLTTRILPARAVNVLDGNIVTTLSPGELNRMPTQ